jgi:hypothetical protein
MTDAEFNSIMTSLVARIRDDTPIDTGNLRLTATSGRPIGGGAFVISVSERIAPYFPAVNYRERYENGQPNPNYHYFENSLERHLETIAQQIGGVIEYE